MQYIHVMLLSTRKFSENSCSKRKSLENTNKIFPIFLHFHLIWIRTDILSDSQLVTIESSEVRT